MAESLELYAYRQQFMTTKADILEKIAGIKKICESLVELGDSDFYLKLEELGCGSAANADKKQVGVLAAMFAELYESVESRTLFDAPDGFWHYVICVNTSGIDVRLRNDVGYINIDYKRLEEDKSYVPEFVIESCNDEYKMFEVKSRLLIVEQYAELYEVQEGTIRQWIRRGKIRSAVKYGSEWRIPELACVPNRERGYSKAIYMWDEQLTDVPEKIPFVNDFSRLEIEQNPQDKKISVLKFFSRKDSEPGRVEACTTNEREKIELYMTANPYVRYADIWGTEINYK